MVTSLHNEVRELFCLSRPRWNTHFFHLSDTLKGSRVWCVIAFLANAPQGQASGVPCSAQGCCTAKCPWGSHSLIWADLTRHPAITLGLMRKESPNKQLFHLVSFMQSWVWDGAWQLWEPLCTQRGWEGPVQMLQTEELAELCDGDRLRGISFSQALKRWWSRCPRRGSRNM